MSYMLRFQNQMSGAKFSWKSVKILTLPIREQNEVTNSYHQRNWVKKKTISPAKRGEVRGCRI